MGSGAFRPQRSAEAEPLPAGGARGVLITRPEEEAIATAEQVTERGFVPIVSPVMQVEKRRPKLPARVAGIVVASGNAIAALTPGDVPLFAVGDATAERARAAGFANVFSAGRDAAALGALVAQEMAPGAGPLLLASGARQGGALAADLRGRGFRVIRRVCYAAGPVSVFPEAGAVALERGEVAGAIFLSGETAAAFVRLLPRRLRPMLGGVVAAAIGKGAADALKPLGWRDIRIAARPTLSDVLAVL